MISTSRGDVTVSSAGDVVIATDSSEIRVNSGSSAANVGAMLLVVISSWVVDWDLLAARYPFSVVPVPLEQVVP